MFNGFLKHNKFSSKCKSQVKVTKARIEMIKKKRNAMQKYLRKDIADLLRNGLDVNAYGRAEGLLAEMNLSACYDYLEQFCVQVSNNLAAMNSQRECPEDCKEAVSSLVFAAARIADLPELRDLRTIFTERYGNSLECFVSPMFVEKLKSPPPTKDMKLQLMQDIAKEIGLTWNAYAMEQKLYGSPAFQRDAAQKSVHDDFRTHKKTEKNMPYEDAQREMMGRGGHAREEIYDDQKFYPHHEEKYDDRKFYLPQQSIPSPYEKSKVGKTKHLDESPKPAEPDTFVSRRDNHRLDNLVSDSNPKPRSVRRNRKAALAGESRTDKKDAERLEKDHHNLDKEERKKSANGTGKPESVLKPPPQQAKASTWRLPKWGSWDVSLTKETSLPVEPENPPETKKGHARAASLGSAAHVHPKLPDYDEFVARLAALKREC